MSLQFNTNTVSVKLLESIKRDRNLLPDSINGLAGGSKPGNSGDQAFAFGRAASPDRLFCEKKSTNNQSSNIFHNSDKCEISLSGLYRMVKNFNYKLLNESIYSENAAARSMGEAILEIYKNSQLALSIQANQTPTAVMKLLE